MSETVRVYVGTDRSQLLAVKVLEHSIKRHTKLNVEVYPMLDLPVRKPQDPKNWQRTGFSFSRFCIPELAGYSGKAIYMDADMLVFKDIASLWNIPFDDAKVIIQEEIPEEHQEKKKIGAPQKRIKQCAVMLLDCSNLDWKIDEIIDGFDRGEYDYENLMYYLCILDEKTEIKYGVPFTWNSLEHYDRDTCLIHYTDMSTQPWVSNKNQYGYLWLNEVRLMLKNGTIQEEEIENEIKLGYFRPSLIKDIKYGHSIPYLIKKYLDKYNNWSDRKESYQPHQEVYRLKREREQAIKKINKSLLLKK